VHQQLKALLETAVAQQAESSTSHQRSERGRAGAASAHGPNPPPSRHQDYTKGGEAATSTVRSQLGPDRDMRNTIEPHRWAGSVDNHRDNRSCHHHDRGRGQHHSSGDDPDRSCSPNQRGPRAFGQSVRDARLPSRFRASTNVPRYDGDTNPSMWLEDSRLACHTGGVTNALHHKEPAALPQ
jgi:hypothetical protein